MSSELFKLVEENAKAIAELRMSISELKKRSEETMEAISELRMSIVELRKRSEENMEAISELRMSIAELRSIVEENSRAVERLMLSLEAERDVRRGEIGRLEGRMIEMDLIGGLRDWCSAYGLHVEKLPRGPYRVDAVVGGAALIALIEIAKTGSEADIEQLINATDIYERIRGERPDALVLYVYAEMPSEELIRECEEHGIMVDSSPKRIAKRLAELDEELKAI